MIAVNEPLLDGNEKKYLMECIETGWISSEGPFVRSFEESFAARVGRKFGIAVCNGSAALEAAVAALRIGSGDEVILPTFTIISCAAAVVRAGQNLLLLTAIPLPGIWPLSELKKRLPRILVLSWSSISTVFRWIWTRSWTWQLGMALLSLRMQRRCTGRPTRGARAGRLEISALSAFIPTSMSPQARGG